jgi:hypothetical protein
MKEAVITQKGVRGGFAHWVVRQVTKPTERPARVSMILVTNTVPPPGKDGPTKRQIQVLYDEKFTGAK